MALPSVAPNIHFAYFDLTKSGMDCREPSLLEGDCLLLLPETAYASRFMTWHSNCIIQRERQWALMTSLGETP